jgi:hypothetical protein
MRANARRLHRLEERFGTTVESLETLYLRMRLKAARLRCGLPLISPDRLAWLRGKSIVEILKAGRQRAAWRSCGSEKAAPGLR